MFCLSEFHEHSVISARCDRRFHFQPEIESAEDKLFI